MRAYQQLFEQQSVDWPESNVDPIELGDAQREPRNAGPPPPSFPAPPVQGGSTTPIQETRVGWGRISIDGVVGYGLRQSDGTVEYWRPLPPKYAPDKKPDKK